MGFEKHFMGFPCVIQGIVDMGHRLGKVELVAVVAEFLGGGDQGFDGFTIWHAGQIEGIDARGQVRSLSARLSPECVIGVGLTIRDVLS